jgi:DNA-binding transcriptional ArsR family regulator
MTVHADMRNALYVLVQDYPGLHVRELSRRLGTPVRMVEYHAAALLDSGVLEERREGAYQRLFPNRRELPLSDRQRDALGVLRKPVPLSIALALVEHPDGLSHTDLCRRTGASKANLSHHLKDMVDCRLVRNDDVYRLVNPEKTRQMLQDHKPVPDLRSRFSDLWSGIYGLK